jgi:hypothetical protein
MNHVDLNLMVFKGGFFRKAIERLMFTIPKYDSTRTCINSDTSMIKYVTVKLPQTLAEQIDEILENRNLGYTSRAELVKEAVRTFISTKTKKP